MFHSMDDEIRRDKAFDLVPKLAHALERLQRAYEALMPGLAHIAVPDYRLINEAPIEAQRVLRQAHDWMKVKR